MSKDDKSPFYIDMDISTEGLANLPKEMKSADLFISVVVNALVAAGKKRGGMRMEEHSRLFKVRTELQDAIKTQEEKKAKLEYEDYKFLMKNWNEHTPDPQSNELVIRVWERLKEAQSRHDRNEGAGA